MQSEIDETDSLKICIARLEIKNAELRKKFAEIEARNAKLKARIEVMQLQHEIVTTLLCVLPKRDFLLRLAKLTGITNHNAHVT